MRRLLLTAALLPAVAAVAAFAYPAGTPPPLPVDPGPAPWERPFSLVAGGGDRRPADGVVAGEADLERVWAGARDGAGRVVVVATTGTWIVREDGRLARVAGLTAEPDAVQPGPRALAALPDGRVAIADPVGRRVVALGPGATTVAPLATSAEPVEALGLDRDGTLLGAAAGRVLRLRGAALVPAEKLYGSDGIREVRGVGGAADGLLAASLFPNGDGGGDDPEQDDSSVQLVGPKGARTVFSPPPQSSVRSAAVLPDGRALLATNALTEGELDGAPLVIAAAPTLDRQAFGYGVGEEFYGWISRRRVLLRGTDGVLRRVRWAGPPADAITPDGAADVLVASAGRLWSTRPGLGAPGLGAFAGGDVAVRLAAAAPVSVTVRTPQGKVLSSTDAGTLPAGTSVVRVPRPTGQATVRVIVATGGASARTASDWAFPDPALSPALARRVLSQVARRLNIGFEGAVSHGVDRCRPAPTGEVTCRWTTGRDFGEGRYTERTVRVARGTTGYVIRAGAPRPSPKAGRNTRLLGAPFDASA